MDMKAFASCAAAGFLALTACARPENVAAGTTPTHMTTVTDNGAAPRPPFTFSKDDEALLDAVQRAAFLFLFEHASKDTGMVPDRSSKPEISIAGVGFQLAAIPAAVERGWITEDAGRERTALILKSLESNPDNRKFGLFYHYLDPHDAGPAHTGYEHVVSTIDNALLFAGVIVAGEYFKADPGIHAAANRLVEAANWKAFMSEGERYKPHERGFITLGWKPRDKHKPTAEGELLPYVWMDAGDEQRLTTFLAVAAPNPEHRVEPGVYYRMRRTLGVDPAGSTEPFFWFQWSGALFTSFFAHCFIDFANTLPDDPAAFGVERRASIDWWVSARRTVLMHRRKAIENPKNFALIGENVWGMNASDAPDGYRVPGLWPVALPYAGMKPDFDFVGDLPTPRDEWGEGTVAPYSAGCSIMFAPSEAVAALRHMKNLQNAAGEPLIWREPGTGPDHYGFLDAFSAHKGWVAPDYVAIDQGPLMLAIENARTGLIWRLFRESKWVREGEARLGWRRRN
ncbi:MAG: DUF3131 domain-containing protein [Planctomycetes bacterium]|nr:DUF3131 domain-containing protein [Planctomycetota bacterium]